MRFSSPQGISENYLDVARRPRSHTSPLLPRSTPLSTRVLKVKDELAERTLVHTVVEEAREWEMMIGRHEKNSVLRKRTKDLVRGFLALARLYQAARVAALMVYKHNEIFFLRWRKLTRRRRDTTRMFTLAKRSIATLLRWEVRRAWGSWDASTELARRRGAALAAALRGWRARGSARAWRMLRILCADRAKLAQAAKSLVSRLSRAALNAWREMVEMRAQTMRLLRKGGAAIQLRALRVYTSTWHGVAIGRKEHLLALRGGASALCNRLMRRGFNCYCEKAAEHGRRQRLLRQGASALVLSKIRRASNAWQTHTRDCGAALQGIRKAAAAFLLRLLRRGLSGWIQIAC